MTARSGPSRRTLVRTAAHAAWTAPLVQSVAAAPAFAASHALTITAAAYWWKTWTFDWLVLHGVAALVTVRNDGPSALAADLVLRLRFPPAYVPHFSGPMVSNMPVGWLRFYGVTDPSGTVETYTYGRPWLDPGQERTLGDWSDPAEPFAISWKSQPDDPITVTAETAGATPATAVLTRVPGL